MVWLSWWTMRNLLNKRADKLVNSVCKTFNENSLNLLVFIVFIVTLQELRTALFRAICLFWPTSFLFGALSLQINKWQGYLDLMATIKVWNNDGMHRNRVIKIGISYTHNPFSLSPIRSHIRRSQICSSLSTGGGQLPPPSQESDKVRSKLCNRRLIIFNSIRLVHILASWQLFAWTLMISWTNDKKL